MTKSLQCERVVGTARREIRLDLKNVRIELTRNPWVVLRAAAELAGTAVAVAAAVGTKEVAVGDSTRLAVPAAGLGLGLELEPEPELGPALGLLAADVATPAVVASTAPSNRTQLIYSL